MADLVWAPKPEKKCVHDLPCPSANRMHVFRCEICDGIFESKFNDDSFMMGGWYWKQRSERWLRRRVKKTERKNG